jgi:23S rRNA pseudouridine1911/1915/1917 synthase
LDRNLIGIFREEMESESDTPPSLEIIFESDQILVLNKPVGLATQAPSGIDCLEFRVRRYLARTHGKSGQVYVGVPHRLDRPVSGVIVMAKDKRSARLLAEQFQARTVTKTYWVLVEGLLIESKGEWRDWMRKIPGEARSETCDQNEPGAQQAVLDWKLLESVAGGMLLEIRLGTGRTHQIRVQAASRGHPIFGDTLYGSTIRFGPLADDERLRGIALHARSLKFREPDSPGLREFVARLPEFWPTGLENAGDGTPV